MMQNSHDDEQVAFMLSQLEKENWLCHPMLPEKWRVKKLKVGHLFFTSEGALLNLTNAMSYIEEHSDKYTADDRDVLADVAKSLTEKVTKQSYEWLVNESVPEGWKMRRVSKSGTFGREYFLCPDGREINGRVKTIQFLLKQGLSLNHPDIIALGTGLISIGWQEDPEVVPNGWMKKPVELKTYRNKTTNTFKYISPDFREFNSLAKVYHHMCANNYPSKQVDRVKAHLDTKAMLSNRRVSRNGKEIGGKTYKWKKAKFLPPEWKTAVRKFRYGRKRHLYLSPNGLLLQSSVLAFQVMVEEGADDEYLEQMNDILLKEGWKEDSNLPEGWRFNVDNKHFPDIYKGDEEDILFLTGKAQILTGSEALKLFTESKDFNQNQDFLSLVQGLRAGSDRGWRKDPLLPVGWRIRDIDLSFKKEWRILSNDKKEFESIFDAYIHMVGNQGMFTEEEIQNMRDKLYDEGFEENVKLPDGWRIIRNRGENLFQILSREGILYQTLYDAQLFMEEDDNYDDVNIVDIEELCMAEVTTYLCERGLLNTDSNEVKSEQEMCSPNSSGKKRKRMSENYERKRKKTSKHGN